MKTGKSNFHDNKEMYSCNICGHQVAQKERLVRHKKIVHEGVKYSCVQCNHQAKSKGNLAGHIRPVQKESNILACNATITLHQKQPLLNTKGQYMKGLNTPVGNVIIKQVQREI